MMDIFELQNFENMVYFYNKELQNIKNIRNYLTNKECLKLIKQNIITYNHEQKIYELTSNTKEVLKNYKICSI